MLIIKDTPTSPERYYDDDGVLLPDDHPEVMAIRHAMAYVAGHSVKAPSPILLDATVIAERRSICNACDQFNSETDRCRACGCGDHMSRRVQSPYATCPMKRWPLHLPANT